MNDRSIWKLNIRWVRFRIRLGIKINNERAVCSVLKELIGSKIDHDNVEEEVG